MRIHAWRFVDERLRTGHLHRTLRRVAVLAQDGYMWARHPRCSRIRMRMHGKGGMIYYSVSVRRLQRSALDATMVGRLEEMQDGCMAACDWRAWIKHGSFLDVMDGRWEVDRSCSSTGPQQDGGRILAAVGKEGICSIARLSVVCRDDLHFYDLVDSA